MFKIFHVHIMYHQQGSYIPVTLTLSSFHSDILQIFAVCEILWTYSQKYTYYYCCIGQNGQKLQKTSQLSTTVNPNMTAQLMSRGEVEHSAA